MWCTEVTYSFLLRYRKPHLDMAICTNLSWPAWPSPCLVWFCGFALVLFYFVLYLYCPLFRVEPICFVMFFRTIKIHHHQCEVAQWLSQVFFCFSANHMMLARSPNRPIKLPETSGWLSFAARVLPVTSKSSTKRSKKRPNKRPKKRKRPKFTSRNHRKSS